MTQLRQLRALARSTTAKTTYRRKRPSSISRESRGSSNGIQHPSADEVSHLWEGVVSVKGEWLHLDPALVEWGTAKRKLGYLMMWNPSGDCGQMA